MGIFPTIAELGMALSLVASSLDPVDPLRERGLIPKSGNALQDIDWFGEVVGQSPPSFPSYRSLMMWTDLCLDGQVLIEFPCGRRQKFPLDQLELLDDGMEEAGLMEGEGMYASEDEMMQDQEGWEDEDHDVEPEIGWADESLVMEDLVVEDVVLSDEGLALEYLAAQSGRAEVEDHPSWERFKLLEEAPLVRHSPYAPLSLLTQVIQDHHYINESIQAPSRAFMSRIAKEFAVLASLPPNILVRAYENRSDLLRCLIIGPEGTPFAQAPFLFDLFLSPSKFPLEPPFVLSFLLSRVAVLTPRYNTD